MASLTMDKFTQRLTTLAVLLALIVVILGAYTRLTDAGLGCPDWPGCYGHLLVPESAKAIQQADALFPNQPLEPAKAWSEMVHRYAAGTLGLLIFILAVIAVSRKQANRPLAIPLALVMLVLFQAALGRWTVTLQLLPVVVMGHLLGGIAILALLWVMRLSLRHETNTIDLNPVGHFRPWAIVGLLIVIVQIALGGWTSANYAALACPDFPFCHGNWLTLAEWRTAFNVWMPLGANFQGGVLDSAARMTIQMVHRLGALVTGLYLLWLGSWLLFAAKAKRLRVIGGVTIILLILQICFGIANVVLMLPLAIAVLHNATAALLLLTIVTLVYLLYAKPARK